MIIFGILDSCSILKEKDPNIVKRIKSNVKTTVKTQTKLNKSRLPFDYYMTASLGMYLIYSKVNEMAGGYTIEGGELYKNVSLLEDIIYCLDYMHDNYYTKRFQRIFTGFDNWWYWVISMPQLLLETLIYIKDELPKDLMDKYLTPLNEYIYTQKIQWQIGQI